MSVLVSVLDGFPLLWPFSFVWAVALVIALVASVFLQHMLVVYQNAVRQVVMPAACDVIGGIIHTTGAAPDLNFTTLTKLGLLPQHNCRIINDVFRGQHRGTGFTMAEVKLRQRDYGHKGGSRIVFFGLVLAIRIPQKIPARVERVTPSLRDSLAPLTEAHQGAKMQGVIVDHAFFVAMSKKTNRFRVGSLFRSLNHLEAEMDGLLHDVQIVRRVIDCMYGDRPLRSRDVADAATDPPPASERPSPFMEATLKG